MPDSYWIGCGISIALLIFLFILLYYMGEAQRDVEIMQEKCPRCFREDFTIHSEVTEGGLITSGGKCHDCGEMSLCQGCYAWSHEPHAVWCPGDIRQLQHERVNRDECPNGCGPMAYSNPFVAKCSICGFKYTRAESNPKVGFN